MRRIASTVSLKVAQQHSRVTSTHSNGLTRASSSLSLIILPRKSSRGGRNARPFEAENSHRQLLLESSNRHDHWRLLSSTAKNPREQKPRTKLKHIEINACIIAFGKNKDWAGILDLYQKGKEEFNNVNYATSMSQLGRIRSLRKDDRRLEEMMVDIATTLQNQTAGYWDAQAMTNVLHAVAKMKLNSDGTRRLTDSILGERNLKILLENGNCQEIANVAWSCAKLEFECLSLFKAIDNNAFYLVENGTAQAIANTAWACATLGIDCPTLFRAIDKHAMYLVTNGSSQEIANTAWACAKLGVKCPSLFNAIDNNALQIVRRGSSQEIANTAWACATVGIQCPTLFQAIENNALDLVENGNFQEIANTAWACATLGVECPSLFKAIDNKALYLVEQGTSQTISNTAWACAKLGIECPSLFQTIDKNALYLVENGTPQAIANTAWACAKLGVQCPSLFKAIDINALYLVGNGKPQAIANTAWACATLEVECRSLFQAIDDNSLFLVQNGTAQAIVNTAWACATLAVECPSLFKAIDNNAKIFVENGTSQNIAIMAWACATLGFECPSLFQAIDNKALFLVENGTGQDIANMAWACATLGVECPLLFKTIGTHMEILVESCDVHSIAILCYSFAILDLALDHEPQFRILWNRATIIKLDEFLNKENCRQLLQTFALVSRVMQLPPPTELVKHLEYLRQDQNLGSYAQKEMSQLLIEMGISHEMEASPLLSTEFVPGFLAIDAACKEHRLAIEFDGLSHFINTSGKRLEGRVENGPTKAKRRFLERLGWKVVNVRHWEWESAKTKDEKKKLLAAKLLAVDDLLV